jgi:hypothetical protein
MPLRLAEYEDMTAKRTTPATYLTTTLGLLDYFNSATQVGYFRTKTREIIGSGCRSRDFWRRAFKHSLQAIAGPL